MELASNVCSPECEHGVEDEACAFYQPFRNAVCFFNADDDQLLTQMLEHLSAIQVARSYYQHKIQHVFLTLNENISGGEKDDGKDAGDEAMEVKESDEPLDPRMPRLLQKRGTLNRFMDGLMRKDWWDVGYEEEQDSEDDNEEESEQDYENYEEVELERQLAIYGSLKKDLEQLCDPDAYTGIQQLKVNLFCLQIIYLMCSPFFFSIISSSFQIQYQLLLGKLCLSDLKDPFVVKRNN